jgi:hypothetical protein
LKEYIEASLVPKREGAKNLVLRSRRRAGLYREVVQEDIAAKKDLIDAAGDIEILCAFIERHVEEVV